MLTVNLYDKCSVELTDKSANYINNINMNANYFMRNTFVDPVLLREDYTKGEYFCSNLITVAELHLKMQELGIHQGFFCDVVQVENESNKFGPLEAV